MKLIALDSFAAWKLQKVVNIRNLMDGGQSGKRTLGKVAGVAETP